MSELMGPEASVDPPLFPIILDERQREERERERYARESALNVAMRWAETQPENVEVSVDELIAAARKFNEFTKGEGADA